MLALQTAADDSCGQPGNLTYNCNFDHFVDRSEGGSTRIVPDGWIPWVTMGNPAFDRDDHGSAPGAPAQRIWSDGGAWTAGLYQQVPVAQGRGYVARIDWAAPNAPDIERRLGIDPLGGTDPMSPSVVWGSSSWEDTRMPDLHVSAYAQAPTITVFVWTHHPISHGADQVFLDAVTLVEDPTMPSPTPKPSLTPNPSPTPTRSSPTRTPSPVPPTNTPTVILPSPSPIPTDTPVPLPTDTPTVTPTPTWTATPSPIPPADTPAPAWTPTRTPVPVARVVRTPEARPAAGVEHPVSQGRVSGTVFLYVAAGAVAGAVLLVCVGLAIWFRSRRTTDLE